jgi:hypothetical protein
MLSLPGTRQIVINQAFNSGDQQETLLSKIAAVLEYIYINNAQVMTAANYQSKSCTRYLEIKLTMSRETSND